MSVRDVRQLAAGEIHLWFTDYEQATAALLSSYRALLTDAERAQEQRFHFARDRRRYVVTRALLRTTLSTYCPRAPLDWQFSVNAFGRPELCVAAMQAPGCENLCFNLSHTHTLIVLAVGRDTAIGVDVESTTTRDSSIDIAERYFARAEVRELSATPPAQRHQRFFEFWTLKESYIKGRGMGLSIPLDQFAFSLADPHSIAFEVRPELGDDAARWQFWQWSVDDNYVVALCASRTATAVPRVLRARAVVPLVADEPFELDVRRASR